MNRVNNIIIIEDDLDLARGLQELLVLSSFEVHVFHSAEDYLLSRDVTLSPCIFIVDLNLPGILGTDIVKVIRHQDKLSTVFVMTGDDSGEAFRKALTAGADDFLLKPYNSGHLIQKIRNAQQKLRLLMSLNMDYGVKLIPEARLISYDGAKVKLTNREYLIAKELISAPDEIHAREKLVKEFNDGEITERTIDVHVSSLRRKIAGLGLEIETCRGKGYRISGLEAKPAAS